MLPPDFIALKMPRNPLGRAPDCRPAQLRSAVRAQIYKKTGNLRAVQLLLGHTKMDSTVRYLGVELEDALAIAEAIEI